jgi:hypothetical protein
VRGFNESRDKRKDFEGFLDVLKWGLIIIIAGVVFYFVSPTQNFQAIWLSSEHHGQETG